MALLNPYLNFDGTTREAMEHYRAVLGGKLDVMTFGEAGMAGDDGPPADAVLHAQLVSDLGLTLMASDANPHPQNGIISISGDEAEEIERYYIGLADGGEITMAMDKAPWGDEFGEVVDRYGVRWMFNISASQT